jgi:hypothetical protein
MHNRKPDPLDPFRGRGDIPIFFNIPNPEGKSIRGVRKVNSREKSIRGVRHHN